MATYASADWHGCYWIWEQVKNILQPDDKLYFLGDACDRSNNGWQIIKELIDDPRIIYLIGNHEDLMLKVLKNWHGEDNWTWDSNIELWYWNGGEATHNAFLEDDIPVKKKMEYLRKLCELSFCAVYTNKNNQQILLSHAGCDDFETANHWDKEKFLWDRNHNMYYDTWYGKDNEVIVHGHTPIELMIKEQKNNAEVLEDLNYIKGITNDNIIFPKEWLDYGAYWYAKNHKVNIDTGAVWNNTSVLLNLDTWEETILEYTKKE